MGRIGLGGFGSGWVGSVWSGLGGVGVGWVGLEWAGLSSIWQSQLCSPAAGGSIVEIRVGISFVMQPFPLAFVMVFAIIRHRSVLHPETFNPEAYHPETSRPEACNPETCNP